jgi:hypothetical protein
MISLGINSILIHNNPIQYEYPFRHKLDVYIKAMEMFDEVVYLDWDCVLTKKMPENFWDNHKNKREIQCCLYKWKRSVCPWREKPEDQRYIVNNGYLYIRDKTIPNKMIEKWNSLPDIKYLKRNDETSTSLLIDSLSQGQKWNGLKYYQEHFEPDYCIQHCNGQFDKSDYCFEHFMD